MTYCSRINEYQLDLVLKELHALAVLDLASAPPLVRDKVEEARRWTEVACRAHAEESPFASSVIHSAERAVNSAASAANAHGYGPFELRGPHADDSNMPDEQPCFLDELPPGADLPRFQTLHHLGELEARRCTWEGDADDPLDDGT